jgi:uncharacterized ferritin-like protein (DUF455 family)
MSISVAKACLREAAVAPFLSLDAMFKAQQVRQFDLHRADVQDVHKAYSLVPGLPLNLTLVSPRDVPVRSIESNKGRAMLLHAIAHIEFNAIHLALDMVLRFPSMPEQFYRDWWKIAQEEALHFELLVERLAVLGHAYGDYPAHSGLWDIAEKTANDLAARLALVPRLLEARGLDVSPAIRNKLAQSGDEASGGVLDIILRDEIGHVAIGNDWYRWVCGQRGLDPLTAYSEFALRYDAPNPRPPFNWDARKAAGFNEAELEWLTQFLPTDQC